MEQKCEKEGGRRMSDNENDAILRLIAIIEKLLNENSSLQSQLMLQRQLATLKTKPVDISPTITWTKAPYEPPYTVTCDAKENDNAN